MVPFAMVMVMVMGRIALVMMISTPAKCGIVMCLDGGDHDEGACDHGDDSDDDDCVKLIAMPLVMMMMIMHLRLCV